MLLITVTHCQLAYLAHGGLAVCAARWRPGRYHSSAVHVTWSSAGRTIMKSRPVSRAGS